MNRIEAASFKHVFCRSVLLDNHHPKRINISSEKKFRLPRNVLRAIGLSPNSADQVVDFIVDLLVGKGKSESTHYQLRYTTLSPIELSLYGVGTTLWIHRRGIRLHHPPRYQVSARKICRVASVKSDNFGSNFH